MSTHDILLIVQYITVGVLFAELLIVFLRWKNTIHSYLFLACISTFISNIGYLFEMKAGSEEAYITALKLSYAGRVWIVFAFFLFSAKMCRVRLHRGLVYFLMFVHIGIYLSVLMIGSNGLYYKEYHFIQDPLFPRFYHANGTLHDLLMALNGTLVLFAITWVIREFRREKSKTAKQRLLMLILAFSVQAFSFVLQITGLFGMSDYYDLTMPGALFGTVFMLIGILGFDLLGAREIAKDFAIDRISEGIIAVDNSGRIQYYNEPAAQIYPQFGAFFSAKPFAGRKRAVDSEGNGEEAEKKSPSQIATPYDILDEIAEAVRTGETLKVGDRIYTPEENDLLYQGENYGKLYALVDDTEHYHYMEELQKQRDIADRANEAKSRFLAGMSHEIRTPINAILGMDEMILREAADKTIRNYAGDIMSASRTLLSLINDILDLSKVEEGKMEIIPVQYDLTSLIGDLVNMTRPRAAKKGLEFHVEADRHIPHLLCGDEIRIRQCVMNLLTNAVKYTESGEVTLKITYSEGEREHILLSFTVEDTGIGMKAEDMENLFSPYKRIEEKRNRAIEGTGLGMSITRQLLELMGSTLEVQSEYGKGSVFSFTVEQEVVRHEELGDFSARFADGASQSYEYHELFHAPDARILVVDDTETNLAVVKSLLKKTRIGIDTAASGAEAIALAAEHHYDVIFIDHMMPDMDGIETLKHIRDAETGEAVPAVALTANAVSGAREMYLEAGFTDYLSKPVEGEKLERMLQHLLPADKLTAPEADESGSAEAAGGTEDATAADLPAWLKELPELDAQAGLDKCGSEEGYLSVLAVFHQTAASKADEIANYYESGDMENYTVKVHALKSSARIIGALPLSELAEKLEFAGKSGDNGYIRDNTDRLLEMYRSLDAGLAKLDQPERNEEELPLITPGALKEAYQTIAEIAGSMDYGLMEDLLKDLRRYRLPAVDRERIGRIEARLTELDWEGILQSAGEGTAS